MSLLIQLLETLMRFIKPYVRSITSVIKTVIFFLWGLKGLRISYGLISFLACLFLLPSLLFASELSPIAQEDKIKAVYIFNFIRFTEWPEIQSIVARKSIKLSILGNDDVLKTLEGKAFRNTSLGVSLNVRSCVMPSCTTDSQALFIDSSKHESLEKIFRLLSNKPVLTISDTPKFVEKGGMIELKRDDGRIIFRINLQAIKRANLYVSSQLLQMAEIVENKP